MDASEHESPPWWYTLGSVCSDGATHFSVVSVPHLMCNVVSRPRFQHSGGTSMLPVVSSLKMPQPLVEWK